MRPFQHHGLLLSLISVITCVVTPRGASAQVDSSSSACEAFQPPGNERLPTDLAGLEERIDEVFGLPEDSTPGSAVIVLHDGRIVAQRHFGLASLEHGVPFTSHHVVRIPYSEGREFIAIAAVFMEHDGLIRIGDRVREYFPQLPEWSEPVTLRDLLDHRSGFVDEWSVLLLMHGSMANRFDESQFLRLLEDQPAPEIEPGVGYMYSNSDYGLLRLVLEKAAGEDLGSYMERRVFKPLRMNSTRVIRSDAEVIPHHAPFYAPDGDGFRHSDTKRSPGGNYSIATTACDLAHWSNAHSDPMSEVSRAVATLMDGATEIPGREGHYAFGLTLADVAGVQVIRHEGVSEANYLTRIPELGFSVITFSNRYYEPTENRAIVDFLLDSNAQERRPRFPTQRVAARQLARYAGQFVSTDVRSWESQTLARELIRIESADSTLLLDWPAWGQFDLIPVGANQFTWHSGPGEDDWGMSVEFSEPDPDASLELVIHYNDGYPSESYVRLEEWRPSASLLRRLAGTYHSTHLDYTWKIAVDEAGELVLRAPTMSDIHVEPFQEGEFLLRHEKFAGAPFHVWIRFHENRDGKVTHLTVWNPRLMHHRFDRQ